MKNKLFIVLTVLLGACTGDFLEIKPKGQTFYDALTTKQGVNLLLTGAYADIDGVNGTVGDGWASAVTNWVFGGVSSDDAYKGSNAGDQNAINAVEGFFADAQNLYVSQHWTPLYDGVVRCNDVLKALKAATDMSDTEKKQAEGQARFLRAHYYFELTKVHGKVPYIDENTTNPTVVPNDHILWPEMEADFKMAADALPARWSDKGRATKWAAKTYLARIYMFQEKFQLAKDLLQDVYSNGGYSLMPSYEQNYLIKTINNAESIFEIQYAVNDGFPNSPNAGLGESICGPHFIGSSGFYLPTHSLVSAYRVDANGLPLLDDTYSADDILPFATNGSSVLYKGPVDPRLDHTVGRPGVPFLDWGIHQGLSWVRDPSNAGPYNNKKNMFLKSEQGALSNTTGVRVFPNANNYRVFKLSNVIIWLAECEAEVGSLQNATTLVNLIRNRAKNSNVVRFADGTPAANYKVEPYPTTFPTKEYALQAIRYESRLEFAMEGIRFFELVRWGIVGPVMNNYLAVEGTVLPYNKGKVFNVGQHEIWPIPQRQIDISVKEGKSVLTQNPGY
ncbi:RagB/SusD family nutrient uptake outer membrane protein [Spirosoma sp. KCTC 42546]|uniref:RagB/SusD family nutrient uptake outer membrane protein n=1 Tax=Spirosoma sp. KCTC 42546 TaxID=2520506 RepID=UPI001159466C|nr:RagB/SusD family nutrient uptake outer membrane protein [Spirosoma sp. KCTC 42546]QDK79874.1 RagB/SusD family nutrient uptake outer membrane protein [Spirosoma sp. KCTC 42546]